MKNNPCEISFNFAHGFSSGDSVQILKPGIPRTCIKDAWQILWLHHMRRVKATSTIKAIGSIFRTRQIVEALTFKDRKNVLRELKKAIFGSQEITTITAVASGQCILFNPPEVTK